MFKIIPPSDYKTTPWKNGKGKTVELAINENGSLESFDWRISIATVSENGLFSNFAGLRRDLFLLEGNGIELTHDQKQVDVLTSLYDVSTFDGGSKTFGKLINGTIQDLNLMSKQGEYLVNTARYINHSEVKLPEHGLCFVYGHLNDISLSGEGNVQIIPKGHLFQAENGMKGYQITGENMLVIHLN